MRHVVSRRQLLGALGGALGWILSRPLAHAAKEAVQKVLASSKAPKRYDPSAHKWLMCIDVERCIGCGLCVDACKTENHVPEAASYFRTWIERYIIKKPAPGGTDVRGEVLVDSPNGGRKGFPPSLVPREEILRSFFVPKLCNLCAHSPCSQACPVGATFDSPDGAVLVDPTYCIGCGFCIQACPYGCRFMSPVTKTAEKCSLCYHRITRGLKPACVEVCPGQARIFGDVKNPVENDPIQEFIRQNRVFTLKPHLGTEPRVLYANIDKEVR
ncbi:MAG: 4Fe-4S dicluster domain-containing protein [Verrucomicrobia bacterium]|nr:4Fe-4S dicluster domain-containing protein [Verrucomicrobiota bacterium]